MFLQFANKFAVSPLLDLLGGGSDTDTCEDKSTGTEAPAGIMDAHLSVNNVLFYRSTGRDVISLKHQAQGAGGKRVSMDCKKLIVSALSPHVSTYCTEEVDQLARTFGYHSFFQLLTPFGDKIEQKFQIKDSHFVSKSTDDFALRFTPPLSDILSVQEAQAAGKTQLFNHQSLELLMSEYIQQVNAELRKADEEQDQELKRLLEDSIYIKYFTKMLSSSTITPFESINHPVASFLILTSDQSYEQAKQLLIEFKTSPLPDYLHVDDILPLFVITHDSSDESQHMKAAQLKEHIKKQLFVDVFILGLDMNKEANPVVLNPPILSPVEEELQSTHLSFETTPSLPASSLTAIYKLLKEIIQKKIIPFMEQKILTWDEQVITPRRSITGRLFNVSKRYFGSKSQAQNESASNYNAEKGYYGNQSTEALTRKLADWSFMLRDYRYAYTTYELAKKDYLTDKAWSHLASTSEMAAISLLMGAANITSKLKNDTIDPLLDNANYTYLARCGLKTYALRSILIVAELFCTLRDSWSNSPSAIKWVQKALSDKLVGKIGKSLLLERISCFYSVSVTAQAKVIMNKKNTNEELQDDEEHFDNPLKLVKPNVATIGYTRLRKAALWNLIAARNWDPVLQPAQAVLCLESASSVYDGLKIRQRESSLYGRLYTTAKKSLEE